MTYAALAKSLGITLKSSSSTASASASTTSAGALPVTVQTPASESESVPATGSAGLQCPVLEKKGDDKSSTDLTLKIPTSVKESETNEMKAGEGADADTDTDTDIASSRSSSPVFSSAPGDVRETGGPDNGSIPPASASVESINANLSAKPPNMQQNAEVKEMTAEQLHHAKVLVLDLLGWGVPPDYILRRGVSYKLLKIVFTDLRLRLPDGIVADCNELVVAQT
ncbi:hypothetical protein EW145_g3394 [Phellinidium pouzarii]|uniref:Uncharacterized protein n=1 Tax=Phellinidium pouzarii TaxID=167371 RepID=A0A4S4L972_9AGAM|nr:hypothetical protein EW145_g3394 [Phellinidium pouzarii]